uniref:Uncharacterized protein n=1 Tax=Peronospora matthiolae TaxID=2874970 RepID=A0AAV1UGW9_9STRA
MWGARAVRRNQIQAVRNQTKNNDVFTAPQQPTIRRTGETIFRPSQDRMTVNVITIVQKGTSRALIVGPKDMMTGDAGNA